MRLLVTIKFTLLTEKFWAEFDRIWVVTKAQKSQSIRLPDFEVPASKKWLKVAEATIVISDVVREQKSGLGRGLLFGFGINNSGTPPLGFRVFLR